MTPAAPTIADDGAKSATKPGANNENPPKDAGELCSISGHPVILAKGAKYLQHRDFAHASDLSLALTRTYRSDGGGSWMFGPKWTASIGEAALTYSSCTSFNTSSGYTCAPDEVRFSTPSGPVETFRLFRPYSPVGGSPFTGYYYPSYVTSPSSTATQSRALHLSPTQMVVHMGKYAYTFVRSSPNGSYYVGSVDFAGKRVLTYTRNQQDLTRITALTNGFGATVQFGWSGNRVSSITAPDGSVWSYGYTRASSWTLSVSQGGFLRCASSAAELTPACAFCVPGSGRAAGAAPALGPRLDLPGPSALRRPR